MQLHKQTKKKTDEVEAKPLGFIVKTQLLHDGQEYGIGSQINLPDEAAITLLTIGAIEKNNDSKLES